MSHALTVRSIGTLAAVTRGGASVVYDHVHRDVHKTEAKSDQKALLRERSHILS